jgi:hypothetical protein
VKTAFKTEARILRRRGHSLGELSRQFVISKSTASLWTKDVIPSPLGIDEIERKKRLSRAKGHAILHEMKIGRLAKAESEAAYLLSEVKKSRQEELIALAMMYWCEGIKNDVSIGFTNSDPRLARAFIVLLERTFKIDVRKIRVMLHIHDYHNEIETLDFWSSALHIPLDQFTKTYQKKSEHKYKAIGYKGCVRISYHDAHIARVLLSFAKKFISLYI